MTIDLAALILRVVVGAIFIAQGYRKLFAPVEASHGRANLQRMIGNEGFPAPGQLALIVSACELLGGVLVVGGLITRLALVPLLAIMLVAIVRFKWKSGFLGGWDWPFSVLGSCAALIFLGAGRFSLDNLLGLSL